MLPKKRIYRRPTARLRSTIVLESLESRQLLTGDAPFAQWTGLITEPGAVQRIAMTIRPDDFLLAGGDVLLAFTVNATDTSTLDPAVVEIRASDGSLLTPRRAVPDLAQSTRSATHAILRAGQYELSIGGQHNTTGSFRVDVHLVGDGNGSHAVDVEDFEYIRTHFGDTAGSSTFRPLADTDHDGVIGSYDYFDMLRNLGRSTSIRALEPPTVQWDGVGVETATGTIATPLPAGNLRGTTQAGLRVELSADQDGLFDDGVVVTLDNGSFSLPVTVSEEDQLFRVRVSDTLGQVQETSVRLAYDATPPELFIGFPTSDLETNQSFVVTGKATDAHGPVRVELLVDEEEPIHATLTVDGQFQVELLVGAGGLVDGPHRLQARAKDAVGNTSQRTWTVQVDTTAPRVPEFALAAHTDTLPLGDYATEYASVTLEGVTDPGKRVQMIETQQEVWADELGRFSFSAVPLLTEINPVTLLAWDAAGNFSVAVGSINRIEVSQPATILEYSPANGEEQVSRAREFIVTMSERIDPTTVDNESIYARAAGEKLPGTLRVGRDEDNVTFFPAAPIPASTRIEFVVEGDRILGRDGLLLDADGDGQPGGRGEITFTSQNITRVPGTNVFGYVFDANRRNADGSNIPIVGVRIEVEGLPEADAFTDENGYFLLRDVPAPLFWVNINATQSPAPDGSFYGFVRKPFHSVLGQERPLEMDGQPFNVFLPLLADSDQVPVVAGQATVASFGPAAIATLAEIMPQISPETWALTKVTIEPDSLYFDDGRPAPSVSVVPLPPDRIPAPLPLGAESSLVFTVDALGASNVDGSATLEMPNIDGLAPGEQVPLLAFDHDGGRWIATGMMTVRDDGLTMFSERGGVRTLGWRAVVRTGTIANPCVTPAPTKVPPVPVFKEKTATSGERDVRDHVLIADNDEFELILRNDAVLLPPPTGRCVGQRNPDTMVVEFEMTRDDQAFLEQPLSKLARIELNPGQTKRLPVRAKDLVDMSPKIKDLQRDQLHGVKIKIKAFKQGDPGTVLKEDTIYLYRMVDAVDDNHNDGKAKPLSATVTNGPDKTLEFADAIGDGVSERKRQVDYVGDPAARPQFEVQNGAAHFTSDGLSLTFSPQTLSQSSRDTLTGKAFLKTPNGDRTAESIDLQGRSVPKAKINLNLADFQNVLQELADEWTRVRSSSNPSSLVNDSLITRSEINLIDTPAKRLALASQFVTLVTNLFQPIADGVVVEDTSRSDSIVIDWQLSDGPVNNGSYGGGLGDGESKDSESFAIGTLNFAAEQSNPGEKHFIYAKLINQKDGGRVGINLGNHLGSFFGNPLELNATQFLNGVAKTVAHEASHTIFGSGHLANQSSISSLVFEKQEVALVGDLTKQFRLKFLDSDWTPWMNLTTSTETLRAELNRLVTLRGAITDAAFVQRTLFGYQVTFGGVLSFKDLPGLQVETESGLFSTVTTISDGSMHVDVRGFGDRNDIMVGGMLDSEGDDQFKSKASLEIMTVGLKLNWTEQQAADAISSDALKVATQAGLAGTLSSTNETGPLYPTPHLIASRLDGEATELSFGEVPADLLDSTRVERWMRWYNVGAEPLIITGITLPAQSSFSLPDLSLPLVLGTFESVDLRVAFNPTTSGVHEATLTIDSNDLRGPLTSILTGRGRQVGGELRVEIGNNNLGGALLGGQAANADDFMTLTNEGNGPLTLHELTFDDASVGQFQLTGLPNGFGPGAPLVIPPRESITLGVRFSPRQLGLQRSMLRIVSDDEIAPLRDIRVVGTGTTLDHAVLGNDMVAIRTLGGVTQHMHSDAAGNFQVHLPNDVPYELSVWDAASGLIWNSSGMTASRAIAPAFTRSGIFISYTDLGIPSFAASTSHDSDQDGLPDDIEFALGTGITLTDSDADGIDDFTEIQQDLDPLNGQNLPTGVVGSVFLAGPGQEVDLAATLEDATRLHAFVATGLAGMAIVDVTDPRLPVVLSQIDLLGDNRDVSVDMERHWAAVASGDQGLHLLNVSQPNQPQLLSTITLPQPITRVEMQGGIAYVASGFNVITLDPLTGQVLQELSLGQVADLAFDGELLYAYANGGLQVIDTRGLVMQKLGFVPFVVPVDFGRLFVGGGIANAFTGQGVQQVDVSDPNNPQLRELIVFTEEVTDMAANGSGLLLISGTIPGTAIQAFDTRDAGVPPQFVTEISLPASPTDLDIALGRAFVSGIAGAGGMLMVANYLPSDVQGQQPELSVSLDVEDGDPLSDGFQVREGRRVPVNVVVGDDVQVRHVELLINGQVVAKEIAFPFQLVAEFPTLDQGSRSVVWQVRATDTGGNSVLSEPLVVELTADDEPPTIVMSQPNAGQAVLSFVAAQLHFSEPLDPQRVDLAGITLTYLGLNGVEGGADDLQIELASIDLRNANQTLTVVARNPLSLVGNYRLQLAPAIVADLAGNQPDQSLTLDFSLRPASTVQALRGTPAIPTEASANVGQEIGFSFPGITALTRLVMPTRDGLGRVGLTTAGLGTSRFDVATNTAYYIVPVNATTGMALLQGDPSGQFLLQIVPTLDGIDTPDAQIASADTLRWLGTGFAEGASTYHFGDLPVVDDNPLAGPDVHDFDQRSTLFVFAQTWPLTPLSVSTAGGTSNEFAFDWNLDALVATAASGSQRQSDVPSANPGQVITLRGQHFQPSTPVVFSTIDVSGIGWRRVVYPLSVSLDGSELTVVVPNNAATGEVALLGGAIDTRLPLQIVPILDSVDILSVTPDAARVRLRGRGIAEDQGNVYRFGSVEVADLPGVAGPDVFVLPSEPAEHVIDLTLPWSQGVVGEITIESSGGISQPYRVALTGLQATAASGVPSNPSGTSANPGQVVTLLGEGLSEQTDIVVRYTAANGTSQAALLNPNYVSANGQRATVVVPTNLNGSAPWQILGASFATEVEIVPVAAPAAGDEAILWELVARADGGVPFTSDPSANIGQTIQLIGENFHPHTLVLFPTRDEQGTQSTTAVIPSAISADGTRLEVIVPPLAETGVIRIQDRRVAANLGFNSAFPDVIHRQVTVRFVADTALSTLHWGDGGLESLDLESWGIDNVHLALATDPLTAIFADDFESGARPEWSVQLTDNTHPEQFTRFSGRFNNATQTLRVATTPGAEYVLSFDLYTIDSWDGDAPSIGPDEFVVHADGRILFEESFSNFTNQSQSYQPLGQGTARLQIVPVINHVVGQPGDAGILDIFGSGFMEGAMRVAVGGYGLDDSIRNDTDFSSGLMDGNVSGPRNGQYRVAAHYAVGGPISIFTAGGAFYWTPPTPIAPHAASFTAIDATAELGTPADAQQASANTGQVIRLVGESLTSQTLVTFYVADELGNVGTLTRTGTPIDAGRGLLVRVPELAVTGPVSVSGSDAQVNLQVIPVIRSVGGQTQTGHELRLEGTGLTGVTRITIGGQSATDLQVLDVIGLLPNLQQQMLRLVVPSGIVDDTIVVESLGGTFQVIQSPTPSTINTLPDVIPVDDVGDSVAAAMPLPLDANERVTLKSQIGNNDFGPLDVDMLAMNLQAGDVLTVEIGIATVDSIETYLLLVDALGGTVASAVRDGATTDLTYQVEVSGTYYLAISEVGNQVYDPGVAGSGLSSGGTTGSYAVEITRSVPEPARLVDLSSTATEGTPAQAEIASANPNQLITLLGERFTNRTRIVFPGRGASVQFIVSPQSVSPDGSSLTVAVPQLAITGSIRLEGQTTGRYLQVVPRIIAIVPTAFSDADINLDQRGYVESGTVLRFGDVEFVDRGLTTGPWESSQVIVSLPSDASFHPVQLVTVGGTSALIPGVVTEVVATATSGTMADPQVASANPGQSVTLRGTGFTFNTRVAFAAMQEDGRRVTRVVNPTSVTPQGDQLTVIVPFDAISGRVSIAGAADMGQPLQIVPVITGITLVGSDANYAYLRLTGAGFVEGEGTRYRFGNYERIDSSQHARGIDVTTFGTPRAHQVVVNVPRASVTLGMATITTAGGESAPQPIPAFLAPAEVRSDLNEDGTVDAADVSILFAQWGASGIADLNDDGIVDAADAGYLFSEWTGDTAPRSQPVRWETNNHLATVSGPAPRRQANLVDQAILDLEAWEI